METKKIIDKQTGEVTIEFEYFKNIYRRLPSGRFLAEAKPQDAVIWFNVTSLRQTELLEEWIRGEINVETKN